MGASVSKRERAPVVLVLNGKSEPYTSRIAFPASGRSEAMQDKGIDQFM